LVQKGHKILTEDEYAEVCCILKKKHD